MFYRLPPDAFFFRRALQTKCALSLIVFFLDSL
jgi:hypothetical protein